MISHGQIVSLGSINVDVQVRAARWPEPGETLLSSDFLLHGGGKAANVAYLAHRLGAAARLIGNVGHDVLGDEALRPLRALGVDLRDVKVVAGFPTGTALIVVHPNGDKGIILAANANGAWIPADADAVAAVVGDAPPDSVLVADLEVPVFVVQRAVETARQQHFGVVLDPSPAERMTADLYALVDYLTPNTTEAQQLTGIEIHSIDDAIRAGHALVERGVRTAFVKLREGGCVVVSADGHEHLRLAPVTVVDKTGAGDAFAGALAVAILEGRSTIEAGRIAVAAAALVVTRYGSQPAYPTRGAIESFLAQEQSGTA